jgi:hypothetical protein
MQSNDAIMDELFDRNLGRISVVRILATTSYFFRKFPINSEYPINGLEQGDTPPHYARACSHAHCGSVDVWVWGYRRYYLGAMPVSVL